MGTGIIVTGLPASRKSTIARALALALDLPVLDKDDFLEELYERDGVRTWDDRKKLSRQSDVLFQRAGQNHHSAVLVSHWRPTNESGESGTPTAWLQDAYAKLVEVACLCSAEIAHTRFTSRRRHPGHMDQSRDPAELLLRLKEWESCYPLGVGHPIAVRTDEETDMCLLAAQVQPFLTSH